MKTEVLYGIHPIIEALKAKRRTFASIFLSKGKPVRGLDNIVSMADSFKISVQTLPPSQLRSISHTDLHQGVAARVSPYPWTSFSDIIPADETIRGTDKHQQLLLLDHVVDPQNLGALVRTAHCVGVDGILVPKDRSAPPTPAVSKASAGALEHTRMVQITNMTRTIKVLKQHGFWIYGLDKTGGESIFTMTFPSAVTLVIGGEHKGIGALVKKHCDGLCSIPQVGKIDSLNASVAGAIAMYEVFRQRAISPA